MQIEDDRQKKPPLAGPDEADIARPFLSCPICCEVTVQQVWRNVERADTVCGHLQFACPSNDDPVLVYQPRDPSVPNIDADLFQPFGHSGAAVAAQAQARLLLDGGQNHHVHVLPAAGRATAERLQSAGAAIRHPIQPVDRESPSLFFDETEP